MCRKKISQAHRLKDKTTAKLMKRHTLRDDLRTGLDEMDEMLPHWTSSVYEVKDSTDWEMAAELSIISLAPIVSKSDISQAVDNVSML